MADTESWIRVSDLVLAGCTLLGPVLAVQAQKWVEHFTQKRTRKLATYRTLMATRAAVLTPTHVEALNMVPIDFYQHRPVMDAWEEYIKHLSARHIPAEMWGQKRIELLANLLVKIGEHVGYHFNRAQLETLYFPTAYQTNDQEWEIIRRGVAGLLTGNGALRVSLTNGGTPPAGPQMPGA